jgi:hypothetical protein
LRFLLDNKSRLDLGSVFTLEEAMPRVLTVTAFLVITCYCAFSQSSPPASDPQALSYIAQAMAAMSGGTGISDTTLSGNVTWYGSTGDAETGTAVAYAKGNSESRIDMTIPNDNRSDIRNASAGTPQGAWVSNAGLSTGYAAHNCWTDASWFSPALTSLSVSSTNTSYVFLYVAQETRSGESVQHIQSYYYASGGGSAFTQGLSTVDYYLDSTTLLPSAIVFNAHPDNNANTNLTVEVDFSNYQATNGFTVPFHVQKYVQGTLIFDFTVTNVVMNSGLSDSLFTIS